MSPKVLTERRKVKPQASYPGVLHGFVLSFRYPGIPYFEPGFATIERSNPGDRQDVHGVIHLISRTEWDTIKQSEGVTSSDQIGYQIVQVACSLYDGSRVTAFTLMTAPPFLLPMQKQRRQDSKSFLGGSNEYGGLGVTGAVQPSKRYLNILQEGAKYHNLDIEYQAWLQTIIPFDRSSIGSTLGGYAAASTAALAGLSLLPAFWVLGNVGLIKDRRLATGTAAAKTSASSASSKTATGTTTDSGSAGAGDSAAIDSNKAPSFENTVQQLSVLDTPERSRQQQQEAPLPGWVSAVVLGINGTVWTLHDWVWAPVLGRGR